MDPPNKSSFREVVTTKITVHYEKQLRDMAAKNRRMQYLNVSLSSLRGKPHPALSNLVTSHDVKKWRPHIKMLSGDYLTFELKSTQSGGSPHCRSCLEPVEDMLHILIQCVAYDEIRVRILDQIKALLEEENLSTIFEEIFQSQEYLCQFILDPTSLNLPVRLNHKEDLVTKIFKLSRDYCFAIHTARNKKLQENRHT